ncbi:MAG: M20 family peptidase [Kiloniellaceae bacterium]
MTRKIILGIAGLVVILLVVLAVNTLRIGPPPLPEIPPAEDIAIDKDAAAKRLAQSVRFRTVSHGPNDPIAEEAFHGLRDFLARSFPRVHKTLKREIINDYSLLYTWEGNDPKLKPILLAAHLDVVPVEPGTEGKWTHPPFSGAIADGFVWGRGTMDMKLSVVGILEAVEYLLGQGFALKRTVYLAFGHDEEIGGAGGAARIAKLLAQRGVRLHFTLDEGLAVTHGIVPGVERPVALIGVAEKGYLTLELTARAKGGHSSMPPRGTAIGKLVRAIHRLGTNRMPAALGVPVSSMFEYLLPEITVARRVILANRWLFEPLILSRLEEKPATNALIRTTTAPTILRAGVKENVLPSEAKGLVNFRILPGDSILSVMEHVRDRIDDADVTVRQIGSEPSEPSPVSNIDSASFAALRKTVHQVYPDAVVAPGLVPGRTDSRRYVRLADNSYRFLPMRLGRKDLKRIHGTDERISVETYAEIIRFYIQLLRNTAVR